MWSTVPDWVPRYDSREAAEILSQLGFIQSETGSVWGVVSSRSAYLRGLPPAALPRRWGKGLPCATAPTTLVDMEEEDAEETLPLATLFASLSAENQVINASPLCQPPSTSPESQIVF